MQNEKSAEDKAEPAEDKAVLVGLPATAVSDVPQADEAEERAEESEAEDDDDVEPFQEAEPAEAEEEVEPVSMATPAAPVKSRKILATAFMAYQFVVHALIAALSTLSLLLTSPSFSFLLTLMPLADDFWGLRGVAAVLRLGALALSLVRGAHYSRAALLASFARLITAAAIEVALLFGQPLFGTVSGGVFKPGDAARATSTRLGRNVAFALDNASTNSVPTLDMPAALVAITLVGLTLLVDKSLDKLPTKAAPSAEEALLVVPSRFGIVVHILASSSISAILVACKAVLAAAACQHFKTGVLEDRTGAPIHAAIATLPDDLFISRHEFALFRWAFDSSITITMVVLGDALTSTPATPPLWGVFGTLLLRVGLWLAAIDVHPSFYLHLAVWLAFAMCHLVASRLAPPSTFPTNNHGSSRRVLIVEALVLAQPSWTLSAAGVVWYGVKSLLA
jgi:hypothetical protein